MATLLLQALVGAGKTESALHYLSQTICDPQCPFAKAWVLLATKRQEVAFRQRLIDSSGERAVYFNAEFFNFYELNARLLNLVGQPPRRISHAARLGLIRKILADLLQEGALELFAPIAKTLGFGRVVADLIDELKQNRVFPHIYESAAQTAKDRELALIYSRYQDSLIDSRLVDLEGEAWLALEALEKHPTLAANVDLLLVDGYDQFTPVQAALIALLSKQAQKAVITLTRAPSDRHENAQKTIGRRFEQARENLQAAHAAYQASFIVQTETDIAIARHADLLALGRHIFSHNERVPLTGGIEFIEAPESQEETAAVLRKIKGLLLAGERPDDMLIALRDWSHYHNYMEIYGRSYQLPLLLHFGEPLAQNPAITVLMSILTLAGQDPNAVTSFRRREVLDILHSPYVQLIGMDAATIGLLEFVSHQQQVLGGRANWLKAIRLAAEDYYDEEGEIHPALLTAQEESDLSTALEDFFDAISPPASAPLLAYITWLENLIGQDKLHNPDDETDLPQASDPYSVQMPLCIRSMGNHPDSERIINRDTVALNHFKDLLRSFIETQDFLQSALHAESASVQWQELLMELQASVKAFKPVQRNPIRTGRILVTTAAEARGLPHQHVFILGLSEGLFPAELPEDPLYLDSERLRLKAQGVLLQTAAERSDDSGIFYELISLPRASLTLSRPTVREGKYWVESHLWRMSRDVFQDFKPTQFKLGELVAADQASSIDEAFLAVADSLSKDDENPTAQALYHYIRQEHEGVWLQLENGRNAESQRLSRKAHNHYSGKLDYSDSLAIVQGTLTSKYRWSASQLNEYGTCPYGFFAKRLLKLEALEEPQEGLNALQLGSLNHKILESTYTELAQAQLSITEENQAEALAILAEQAQEIFKEAPRNFAFRASTFWEEEQKVILRRLDALVKLDFSPASPLNKFGSPRYPFQQELKFGFHGTPDVTIPIGAHESIYVRGSVDRIDRIGDKLIIVDYKTGTSPISIKEMTAGRNFQMMVYLLAAAALLPDEQIAGGAFWHIRNRKTSGELAITASVYDQVEIQAAQAHLQNYLKHARSGDFRVQPKEIKEGKCSSYCEFYQLCRLAVTSQYKQG